MTDNTIKKAPGAYDSKGLMTDTNNTDFRSRGPVLQVHNDITPVTLLEGSNAIDALTPDNSKAIANQIARLALAGHTVIKGIHGDFTVCKFGLARYCADFAALVAFAKQVGAN